MIKIILSDNGVGSVLLGDVNFLNKKLGDIVEIEGVRYKIAGASTTDGFHLVKGINCAGKSSMMLRLSKKVKVRRTVYGRIINSKVSSINLVKAI